MGEVSYSLTRKYCPGALAVLQQKKARRRGSSWITSGMIEAGSFGEVSRSVFSIVCSGFITTQQGDEK